MYLKNTNRCRILLKEMINMTTSAKYNRDYTYLGWTSTGGILKNDINGAWIIPT